MTHELREPYSGKNPVPQVGTKTTSLDDPKRKDQSGHDEEKQTENRAHRLAKGHVMHVVDPVTGGEIDITNADEDPRTLNPGENVLDSDLPSPTWKSHNEFVVSVATSTIVYISAAYILSFLLSRLISSSFYATILSLVPPACLTYVLLFRLRSASDNDYDDRIWQSERMRGLRAGSDVDGDGQITDKERTRESAEWANALLRGIWPIVNPDLFRSAVDMIEDIMQSSSPGFIHSVRISDFDLGETAARITAIRSLPDAETKNTTNLKVQARKSSSADVNGQTQNGHDPQAHSSNNADVEEQEELDGNHVNLEVSFAYRGAPSGESVSSKAKNMRLLVDFFLGIASVYGFRVPVWVEVSGAIGTARVRLQLISNPPFVKRTMVSLASLPRITISVVTMQKYLPNVMNLPFISSFVSSVIDAVAAEYIAPKSFTLDLQQLISGDDIKKDSGVVETEAVGVLIIHIHRAMGVKKSDPVGCSDPYITVAYSSFGKPLYSTRIIKGDCNPVFEETAILIVDISTIRLREKLSIQLWDSDRMTVDDMLGVVDVDILDLIRSRGSPVRRISPLCGPDSNSKRLPSSIEYTVGYYGKRHPTPSLRTDGSDPGIPADLRDWPEFKTAKAKALDDLEAAVLVTPPDPEWPSGIVSVQVHEIRELGLRMEGRETVAWRETGRTREGTKGQDDGVGAEEEAEGLPSPYCVISLNDELVYQTRVKPITSSPMFNAGAERFVRDWRTAHVAITVKDARMRECDATLGMVMLKLSELLVNASELTRFYSLEHGIGYGRIRVSVLFRPVEAKLPPNLLGFDVGTLEVREVAVHADPSYLDIANCELKMRISDSDASEKFSRKASSERESDGAIVWSPDDPKGLPVRQRYGSALLMMFRESSALRTSDVKALAVLWLRDLVDNEEGPVEIVLWQTKTGDYSQLRMNYVPPDGNLEFWGEGKERVQRIGRVRLDVVFRPGISEKHAAMMNEGGAKRREALDTFDRQRAGGLRENVGKMDDTIQEEEEGRGDEDEQLGRGKGQAADEEHAMTNEPIGSAEGNVSKDGTNTMVSAEDAETHSLVDDHSGGTGSDGGGGKKKKGIVRKLKDWKEHEKRLHRDHKGIMQVKAARTLDWMKDNVEDGVHAVKGRIAMKTRKQGVETEASTGDRL